MKKIIFLMISLLSISAIAQNVAPSQADIQVFLKSTTYVVLDQSMFGTTYNEKIKAAMEKHWKITPYEFITRAEYAQKRRDPKASFLAKTEVYFDKDKQKIKYQFLNLMLGTQSGRVTSMHDLANFPLAYAGGSDENYSYKLGMILIFMQNHINLIKNNPKLNDKNIIRYYNNQRTEIHDKTLYVLADELSNEVNSIQKIKKYYQYPVKIVTKQEVEQAINSRNKNIVFFHVVRPEKESPKKERCYKLVIDASDARLYYWSMDKINKKKPAGILANDFKKLNK